MPNTNPAAPDDYPPAVIQEADAAGRAAADEAFRRGRGDQATHDAAEAIAAVLARHTVAARMAAAEQDATDRERPGPAPDVRGDAWICAPLGPRFVHVAAGIPVHLDLPIGEGGTHSRTVEARTEIARLTAERDRLAKRVEALRDAVKFVAVPIPCTTSILRNCAAKALAADDKAAQS